MGNNVNCCNQTDPNGISSRQILTYDNDRGAAQALEEFFRKYPRIKDLHNRKSSYCPNINRSTVTKLDGMTVIGNLDKDPLEAIVIYSEGYLYQGQLKNMMREGCGRLISAQGDIYEGKWMANETNGEGTYEKASPKEKYSGVWADGFLTGRGRASYEDGSVFEGDFYQNMRQGRGRVQYADGSLYQGTFKSNLIEGFGTLIGKTHRYQGSWQAGKMHGAGKSYWYNDDDELIETYEGQYENGLKHGKGEYRWSNGRVFIGEWQHGVIKKNTPGTDIVRNP